MAEIETFDHSIKKIIVKTFEASTHFETVSKTFETGIETTN